MGVSSVIHGEKEVFVAEHLGVSLGVGQAAHGHTRQVPAGHGTSPSCSPSPLHQGADGENQRGFLCILLL